MKCHICGTDYDPMMFSSCPVCGEPNLYLGDDKPSILDTIFSPLPSEETTEKSSGFDPYDMDNPDNYSDREYMDDDDYDDFDL